MSKSKSEEIVKTTPTICLTMIVKNESKVIRKCIDSVRDYINYSRENNILTGCGRGSGFGSLLLKCLGITYGVDPLEHDLLWERFLGFDSKKFVKLSDFYE